MTAGGLRRATVVAIAANPVLGGLVALTGGTAWRLHRAGAVDDVDDGAPGEDVAWRYVAALDREQMLLDRQRVMRGMREVARALDVDLRVASRDHASVRWQLATRTASNQADGAADRVAPSPGSAMVEVTVNFLLRAHLAPVERVDGVPVLAAAEAGADVVARALDRRRLADVRAAVDVLSGASDELADDLRLALLVLVAGLRTDWAELLRVPLAPHPLDAVPRPDLLDRANGLVAPLRRLAPGEQSFLEAISDRGEVRPGLLGLEADDPRAAAIAESPALAWKAAHVRQTFSCASARAGAGDVDPAV